MNTPAAGAESVNALGTRTLVDAFDVALLDLDGVVYVGDSAVPVAVGALRQARERGMRCAFVTNNASRTPQVVASHLVDLGVPADAHDVVTSSQAGARIIGAHAQPGDSVLAVGGPGVREALDDAGFVVVSRAADDPVAVMQGFGPDVGWRELAEASLAVRGGAFWVATNLDRSLPVPGGRAPGNGMLVAAVAEAAGRQPDAVAGKPFAALTEESIRRSAATRPLVVGDRLDTDIAGACDLGVPSLLVLTGVTDVATLLRAQPHERPTYISLDLDGLHEEHQAPQVAEDGSWVLLGARAMVESGVLVLTGQVGDRAGWQAALRCACAATWAAESPVDVGDAAARLGR